MIRAFKNHVYELYEKIKEFRTTLDNKFCYHLYGHSIHVMSIEDTIHEIIENHKSISRFGDGEFSLVYGMDINYQSYSTELGVRLKEILLSNEDNLLIGISDFFTNNKMNLRTIENKKWWRDYFKHNARKWFSLLDRHKIYGNLSISRFYIPFKDKTKSKIHSELLKNIWKDRNIIIIEGDKTRMGVGNDLFNTSKSIKRIIAPAKNAFFAYHKILTECKKQTKDHLFLIALGPTATVLAYDLAKAGYQAIDIGHVDLEYEWMKMGATHQIALKNKYVNEAKGGDNVSPINDPKYCAEIIVKITIE